MSTWLTVFVSPEPPSAPVNLTLRHFNQSALTLSWEPPQDRGGRQEVTYDVRCEWEEEAGGRWEPCPGRTQVLPAAAGLSGTAVSVSGLRPRSSYRLWVRAQNSVSGLPGTPPPAATAITIHSWKVSGATHATPEAEVSAGPALHPPPSATAALAVLLLLPVLLAVACFWRRRGCRYGRPPVSSGLATLVLTPASLTECEPQVGPGSRPAFAGGGSELPQPSERGAPTAAFYR